ncbi:MAG: beta-lactamase family protein [Nitrospinae bacterium]|nr:beta-lactamase family protein [Nitrospinota bacterium]
MVGASLAVAMLFFGCASSSSRPTLEQRLDALVADIMANEAPPGMILGVWTPTRTYLKAVGVADLATGTPMTTGLNFRIGSQTKMYISTVILQMVDEGKLALEDTIAQHIDGVKGGEGVTLLQAITNTSGLPSYTLDPAWVAEWEQDVARVWTTGELLAVSNGLDPVFAPGTGWNYSNINFVILGLIAEAVDGEPVADIMRRRLFAPLGMTVTNLPSDTSIPSPHPRGYYESGVGSERLADLTFQSPSWAFTAGGLVGNVAESKRWIEAAVGGGLLSESLQAKRMSTWANPHTGALDAPSGYGMGIGNRDGVIGHTGSLRGWTSGAYRVVDRDATIVFFFNLQSEVVDPAPRLLEGVAAAIRAEG